MAISTGISGLIVGAVRGWALSLTMLALAPPLGVVGWMYSTAIAGGLSKGLMAYSQSAGYAEQAMSAIRVVIAFGMESKETANYCKYLERSKKASIKNHTYIALSVGLLFLFIYCAYGYAFYMGSVFVEYQVMNSAQGRPYSGGDAIGCFFAMIIGLFSLALCSNQMKAVVEGQVAAKFAFEVIDRIPPITIDDPHAEKHTLEGHIELRDVNFFYPTRPDSQVLTNFNATFEKGKTTAIVGPSGAGKSSIAQMIERFYKPTSGQVLVDGKDLANLNLLHYRN